jgi:hypothetical protein
MKLTITQDEDRFTLRTDDLVWCHCATYDEALEKAKSLVRQAEEDWNAMEIHLQRARSQLQEAKDEYLEASSCLTILKHGRKEAA